MTNSFESTEQQRLHEYLKDSEGNYYKHLYDGMYGQFTDTYWSSIIVFHVNALVTLQALPVSRDEVVRVCGIL